MFTGLVADVGEVRRVRLRDGILELEIASTLARELDIGDSVAVNGVCLTATKAGRNSFRTQAMEETLDRSTIGSLERGGRVNLELPLRASDRLGGHIVQGHVDGKARVAEIAEEGDATRITFIAAADLLRFVVEKGSISLDGVSLTVAAARDHTFDIALIPHTKEVTTLGSLRIDDVVNVEVDILAKYVDRLTARDNASNGSSDGPPATERKADATGTR